MGGLTSISGQTAIITGAAQGIGAETAAILAREGCKVVIADIDAGTAPSKRGSDDDADTGGREG
jgi:NAD(P)-dependent dehydrogenase (short-subunit alcohol dehydrogenase family)